MIDQNSKENEWKKKLDDIPVPDSVKPEQMERMLHQKKEQLHKARVRRRACRAIAVAACLLLVVLAGSQGLLRHISNSSKTEDTIICELPAEKTASEPESVQDHTSYEELRNTISDYLEERSEMDKEARLYENTVGDLAETDIAERESVNRTKETKKSGNINIGNASESGKDAADRYTDTDLQVEGVDEGDIVKTNGDYIYSCPSNRVFGSTIRIYRAAGKQSELISNIYLDEFDLSEIYLHETYLIAVGSEWSKSSGEDEETDVMYPSTKTGIYVYDISDPADPVVYNHRTQSGSFKTARKNGHYLYTISNMYVRSLDKDSDEKNYIPYADNKILPEDRLYLPEKTQDNRYLVLTALDITGKDSFCDSLSVLGGSGIYYVSSDNIFIACTSPENFNLTTLSKYSYNNGKLKALATRTFKGVLHDQFSMDEYNGYLRFVSTNNTAKGSYNGLYVLDKNLEPVGSVDKLAKDESIYSSLFMGDRAYFVTYRETDPVFMVDLSDPKKPVVKDKLKLPGFSDYLHGYGDGLLLGIGSNETKDGITQVKLSMFDITSDSSVTEKDKKLLGKWTESIAGQNHKAVLVDPVRNRIGFGVINAESARCSYKIFSYDAKGFHKIASLSPKNLFSYSDCRGLYIDDYFYLVDSDEAVYVYDPNTFKLVKKV